MRPNVDRAFDLHKKGQVAYLRGDLGEAADLFEEAALFSLSPEGAAELRAKAKWVREERLNSLARLLTKERDDTGSEGTRAASSTGQALPSAAGVTPGRSRQFIPRWGTLRVVRW